MKYHIAKCSDIYYLLSIEGSHLTSQVQGSQHAAMLGGKLSVAGGLGTLTHLFVLGLFVQL